MNVLVTGGGGYIGSVVAAELLKAGHRVLVYDDLSRGHRRAAPKGTELIVADTADRAALDRVFMTRPFDAVMHFAALIEAGESMKNPAAFFRNNTANALTLLNSVHGLRYASLRYFNAAGAMSADHGEDHRPESHLSPIVLKAALGQIENVNILGADYPTPDGTCVRDYIHVLDLASAHLLALDA